jgi:hypothetical protein
MIHNFTFHIPLAVALYPDAEQALTTAAQRMQTLHPYLLQVSICEASDGVLGLTLRLSGSDRWRLQHNARNIAAIMFRRAKMDYRTAVLTTMVSEPRRTRFSPAAPMSS